MAISYFTSQATLNTSGNVVTLASGITGGNTSISCIIITNTNTTTTRNVTLLVGSTGISASNELCTLPLTARGTNSSSQILRLNNCPIIVPSGVTLRAYQDVGTDVNITLFGCNEV